MDKPEQWVVELLEEVELALDGMDPAAAALTIQRAFEERERALREALDPFARAARIQGPWSEEWPDDKSNRDFLPGAWPDWGDFKRAAAAMKDKP